MEAFLRLLELIRPTVFAGPDDSDPKYDRSTLKREQGGFETDKFPQSEGSHWYSLFSIPTPTEVPYRDQRIRLLMSRMDTAAEDMLYLIGEDRHRKAGHTGDWQRCPECQEFIWGNPPYEVADCSNCGVRLPASDFDVDGRCPLCSPTKTPREVAEGDGT